MQQDRSAILTPALRIDSQEVKWYFTADYYDGPISGLAHYQGCIYRFCCFQEDIPDHCIYVLHQLTREELEEELRKKEKFETFVGTHWSFDEEGNPLPLVVPSAEMSKKYFEGKKPSISPEPMDRPIVAWFDTRI